MGVTHLSSWNSEWRDTGRGVKYGRPISSAPSIHSIDADG